MQVERKSITTARSAKDYLSKNEIPQLFECLMTGLMYHRPSDHILYLQECLERIKKQGVNGVRWDMFLDSKKTALPPIDSTPRENYRPQPLPEIGSLQLTMPMDSYIVIVQGGPGIDKKRICRSLTTNFPNYTHIDVGSILRERAILESRDSESRWNSVKNIINDGDLAPEEFAIECLIRELNKHEGEKKYIIEGFPRTAKERQDFERFIGFARLKFMLLIDCEEDVCQRNLINRLPTQPWCDHSQAAVNKRIFNYKSNTLAVCKYFDDQNKLRVVDGDRDRDLVMKDILRVFSKELDDEPCFNPSAPAKTPPPPPSQAEPVVSAVREPVKDIEKLEDIPDERPRHPHLPQCRLILLLGGPGSGKTELAQRICCKYPTWVHLDINELIRNQAMGPGSEGSEVASSSESQQFVENWDISLDALTDMMKEIPEGTEVMILEGFPKNSDQLYEFNTEIGRVDFAILLDSEEEAMRARLAEKYCRLAKVEDSEANVDSRMIHFKEHGLPICRYYDDMQKMCIVPADRDILYVTTDFEKVALRKLQMIKDTEVRIPKPIDPIPPPNENNNNLSYEDEEDDQEKRERIDIATDEGAEIANREENDNNEDEDLGGLFGSQSSLKIVEEDNVDKYEEEANNGDEESEAYNVDTKGEADLDGDLEDITVEKNDESVVPDDVHVVLLLGGPGSGKKTLGSHLVTTYSVAIIQVDQLVKDAIDLESTETEQFQKYLANEEFDENAIYALIRRSIMSSMSMSKVLFVLGFPKSAGQYTGFIKNVCPVSATIYLDVDEDTLKNRLAARADPELPLDFTDQLEVFKNNSPELLESLSGSELFSKIDGAMTEVEVLAQVCDFIKGFDFMNTDQ